MKAILFVMCIFSCISIFSESEYQFIGTHYFASFYDCDPDVLDDLSYLEALLKEASEESGATVLDITKHQFEPNGVTILALLSESHASIHTYPDDRACFVDFFTCGTRCDCEKFHIKLKSSLKASEVSKKVIVRN